MGAHGEVKVIPQGHPGVTGVRICAAVPGVEVTPEVLLPVFRKPRVGLGVVFVAWREVGKVVHEWRYCVGVEI